MHKGQEEKNVKACYEFGNDSIKCVLNIDKNEVDNIIKDIKIVYNCVFNR
jgi:hypothetical protein